MRTIWGFDLGVTSVGFAVVRWDGWETLPGSGEILRLGVRIFPESREEKDLSPRNAARRQKRLARRQTRRRRWRRVELRRALAEAGLLPAEDARPPAGQDPYMLRKHGSACALMPHELGWALFHLLKRRGFQGSRKRPEAAKTAEEKKAAQEEQETAAKAKTLAEKLNGRLLGEYLAGIETTIADPQRRRGVGQTRVMVQAELDALWAEQRKHHPSLLTDALRNQIDDIALAQRPTYFRRRTIGRCELEPDEERALKAEWLTQRFEVLQLVNALRLEGGNQRGLERDERAKALEYLERQSKPTWAGLRKALDLSKGARFTHERGKKETVRGNATEVALRGALGPEWDDLPEKSRETIRNEIARAWHRIEYRPANGGSRFEIRDAAAIEAERAKLARHAETEWGLSEEQALALAAIDLPDGNGRHCIKAMRRLLPYLEKGEPYTTAIRSTYGLRESGAPVRRLPGPNPSELYRIDDLFVKSRMESLLAGIRNPTVLRTLGELQKVANTLLRVHGRPDLIRIETTRELKQSPDERRKTDSDQRRREKARADMRQKLAEMGKAADGREGEENVLRLLLWHEQGGRCPYSGAHMGCADALSATATEIDHIFPVSRSFDDSQANKLLCFARENRDKRNRTPFEWLNSQTDRWAYLSGKVWPEMVEKSGWLKAKQRRCLKENLEQAPEDGEETFTNRQLTDTSFIARAAREYLGLLFGGGQEGVNRVQPVSGRAMALLRRGWGIGLGRLLRDEADEGPKARDDHRHHAVDALVVALAGPGSIQQLSRWWQGRETTYLRPKFPEPWPDFWAESKLKVEEIVVSHRVQSKVTGPLHEETRLGDTGVTEGKFRFFAKRKPIQELSANEILGEGRGGTRIADEGVKRAILAHLAAHGIESPKSAPKRKLAEALAGEIRLPLKDETPGPVIRRVRLWQKLKPDGVVRVHATRNIHAIPGSGSNHHIAIYRAGGQIWGRPVSKSEAMKRARDNHPIFAPSDREGKLVMALCARDALQRTMKGRTEYRIVRKFNAEQRIFHKPIWQAIEPEVEESWSPERLLAEGWRKVSIDPIGRVSSAK